MQRLGSKTNNKGSKGSKGSKGKGKRSQSPTTYPRSLFPTSASQSPSTSLTPTTHHRYFLHTFMHGNKLEEEVQDVTNDSSWARHRYFSSSPIAAGAGALRRQVIDTLVSNYIVTMGRWILSGGTNLKALREFEWESLFSIHRKTVDFFTKYLFYSLEQLV